MKRLFICNGCFFSSKKAAKIERYRSGWCISIGPEHWKYGLKGFPRTHSHNARSGGAGSGFRKNPLK